MGFKQKWEEAKVRNAEFAELSAERNLADTRWDWTRTDGFRKLLIVLGVGWPVVIFVTYLWQGDKGEVVSGWQLIPWSLFSVVAGVGILFLLRVSVRTIGDLPDEYLDERMIRIRNEAYVWAYRFLAEVVAIGVSIPLIWMISTSQDPANMTVNFSDYNLLGVLFSAFSLVLNLPSVALLVKNFRI